MPAVPSLKEKLVIVPAVLAWDIALVLGNAVLPKRKKGQCVPPGHPGAGGEWPEFVPPKEGDSRCACPALNAMANHGILPHDGKNITFKQMNEVIRTTYNFSPSFCFMVPHISATMLNKSYWSGTFDLAEISLHNGIEHDGSLLRLDTHLAPDQGPPHIPFVKELLESATGKTEDGKPLLTAADVSRMLVKRAKEAKEANPEFTSSSFHDTFGASNASTLLTIYGGRVEDLEAILIDERLPKGWESRVMEPFGLTVIAFNRTVSKVAKGTKQGKTE
jgi:hypothetical protein